MKYPLLFFTFLLLALTHFATAKELPAQQLEDIQLQIYLDQQHFGPGVLDGKPGRYTRMAIEAYNQKFGFNAADETAVRDSAKTQVTRIFALATVPTIAEKFVNRNLPSDSNRELQAKQKQLSYRSLAEFMAERYHTTEDILIAINGYSKIKNLKLRSPIQVPNVKPFLIEDMSNGKGYKEDIDLSRRWVVIDTQKNQLRIFEARFAQLSAEEKEKVPAKAMIVEDDYQPWDESKAKLIAAFPITPGKKKFTHYGEWKIKNAIEFPTWRYDPSLLHTGVRSKNYLDIPAGPNNPVGVLWMGLTKSGIGIHGTNSPRTIGRAISSGCIRMANWDVVHVPKYARPGSTVIIK
ncbi:MAG: L,D-transpeptidase [Akkermansiaceae bacterium]